MTSYWHAQVSQIPLFPASPRPSHPTQDNLGIDLIQGLDEQQQKVAIVDPTAYKDILTAASRKAALQGQPSGISASKISAKQFDVLRALMEEYARNVPDELAEGRMEQINKAGRNVSFAWSGGINHGDPHYYRVQASVLIPHRIGRHTGQGEPHSLRVVASGGPAALT